MPYRIAALALALTCLTVACVNTPDGPRPALGLNETSILETPPANLVVAEQTNFGSTDPARTTI